MQLWDSLKGEQYIGLAPWVWIQLESAEAFTGRFARSVDLLVNQVLRTLDRVDLKTEGTLLDLINRAEKRGFVTPSEELREMKDVRNIIAHDYAFKGQLP